jgi:hypothetical protein
MRKPYRSVGWLLLPVCATVLTGLRLAALREERDRLARGRAVVISPSVPSGAPAIASMPRTGSQRHFSPQPIWVKRVGQLRLIKWGDQWSDYGGDRETIILRDAHERTVARITGVRVDIEQIQDFTGDGTAEIVISAWGGYQHGPCVYYVYSAGVRPRCLLAYDQKAGDGDPSTDFEPKDLDGDGSKEIISWYDGFLFWDRVPEWRSPYRGGSASVPIVLGFWKGRYVDATAHYRRWLKQRLAETEDRFHRDLHEVGTGRLTGSRAQGMIEYYSVAQLLYGGRTARGMVVRFLSQEDRSLFLENCWRIDRVLADRWKRYAYPPAYSRRQAFASDALPPHDTPESSGESEAASERKEHQETAFR